MSRQTINILLIEHDPIFAASIRDMLATVQTGTFTVEWADTLQAGLACLAKGGIDIILVDLALPDGEGLQACLTLQFQAPRLPVIVLSESTDEALALQAIREGAQDYLFKSEIRAGSLSRAITYAIERKRVELSLEESLAQIARAKQEWEITADSLVQFICLLDDQGRVVRTNRTVERWGVAQVQSVRGLNLHQILHPHCTDPTCYLPTLWLELWTGLQQGHSSEYEVEDPTLDRHLHLQAQPISGQPIPLAGVISSFAVVMIQDISERKQAEIALRRAHDELERRVAERTADLSQANTALRQEITERKQVEAALRASEERFRQFITSISDHIYVTKIEANQRLNLYISPHAAAMTGYPYQNFVDDWHFWSTTVIHPADRAIAQAQATTLAEGQDSESEYRLVCANGEIIWVRDSATVEVQGPAKLVYGVVSNITERKQAEQLLQQQADRLRVLHELDQAILSAQSPAAIVQAVLDNILQLLPYQRASVTLFDFTSHERLILGVNAVAGSTGAEGPGRPLITHESLPDLQQGRCHIIEDLALLSQPSTLHQDLLAEGVRSLVNVPLIARDQLIGALNLGAFEPKLFDEKQVDIAAEVADQLAIAITQAQLYAAEARRRQEAEALRDTATALNSTLNLEEVLERILTNVGRVVPHDAANIMLVEAGVAQVVGSWDYADNELKQVANSLSVAIEETHHLRKMAESGEPLVISDTQSDPEWTSRWRWIHSYAGVPICLNRQVIGFLNLASGRPGFFTTLLADLLQAFADQAAVAIENARLHTETRTQARQLRALNKAGQAMSSSLDLDTVLEQMMVEVNTLFEAEGASVLLHDPKTDELVFAAVATADAKSLIGVRLPAQAGIAGWVMRQGRPLLAQDAQNDPHFYNHIDAMTGVTTQALLAAPLTCKERVIGVAEVINKTKGNFNRHDLEILGVLTGSAAIAIENARLYDEVERHTRQLTVLHELDRIITTSLHISDVYQAFAENVARLLPFDRMMIVLLEGKNTVVTYVSGRNVAAMAVGTILPNDTSASGWVAARGQPLLRDDISAEPAFSEDKPLADLALRSNMILPLRVKGRIIGTWHLTNHKIGAYATDDLKIAQAMADQLAISIDNARLFEQVQAGREQLRQLAHQVVAAQEEERQRLSYELHDEAGQALVALKMTLELILMDLPQEAEPLRQHLSGAVNLADTTMERLRALARDLRPPALDAAGLNPTLEGLCRDFAHWSKMAIDYVGIDINHLSDSATISLYRFLQEALTNVAKHAQANQVWVALQADHQAARLTVADDGQGFDRQVYLNDWDQPKSIGLLGMQERMELLGGWLEIISQPGQGTRLTAHIPLEDN
jgi:PAS domain S-box-containing protein